jgi:hypothetical protein
VYIVYMYVYYLNHNSKTANYAHARDRRRLGDP